MKLENLFGYQIGELVNKKELSAVEVIKYFIDRIEKRNPSINAFTYTKFDEALREAEIIDRKLANNEYVGPFAGVPVCLKDFLPSKKGWTNSHGGVKALITEDVDDSEFYKAARKLGAIAIGKSNAPAFGFSGTCSNKLYGETHNPFNLNYSSGGSSGGTAAAVADGLVVFGEGGDAGGSIRIPSAWCNCFGFKSALGTVPSYCRPDGWTATHPYCFNGAITKCVTDSAILLNQMAQYNPRDPISLPIAIGKAFNILCNENIKGMKIGYTSDFGIFNVDEEIDTIVRQAAYKLQEAGAIVEPIQFSFKSTVKDFAKIWCKSLCFDSVIDIMNWKNNGLNLLEDHYDELPQEFIYWLSEAKRIDVYDTYKFNLARTEILDQFENAFENYDIIISPISTGNPLPVKGDVISNYIPGDTGFIDFAETFIVNFVGYPAASVPAGLTKDLLPVGMHVIGKQYHNEDVLAVARTSEIINPWDYSIPNNRKI